MTMRNPDKCAVDWCAALPMAGWSLCALHAQYPTLHSFENQHDWLIRINRQRAAAKRAAAKAAESDATLTKRGTTNG